MPLANKLGITDASTPVLKEERIVKIKAVEIFETMKRIIVLILSILLPFSFFSCSHKDYYVNLRCAKPGVSTIASVAVPKRSKKDDLVVLKVGVGKRFSSQYKDHIITVLSIDAPGVMIEGSQDTYSMEFDITEEQYLCTKDNKPQYFIDIPLDFSNCSQTSGTIVINLISYFLDDASDGSLLYVNYIIEDEKIIFSAE